jgi:hypothetical protein
MAEKKSNKKINTKKKEVKFRTIDDVQAGDFLVYTDGENRVKVHERLGSIIFASTSCRSSDNNNSSFGRVSSPNLISSYKEDGWTLESADSKEVTMAEVCKRFGYNVKIKK